MPAPIDITARPQAGQPKSNLTSQLRAADQNGMLGPTSDPMGGRSGSITHTGAIPMNARLRRESMANNSLARSLMMGAEGMSWAGVSVGSWIRDDILMTGTSPYALNSPSFHSSSYLPKLEADFCRDFSCCGIPLPTLHDLLTHYEERHAQQVPAPGADQKDSSHQHNGVRQPSHRSHPQNSSCVPMRDIQVEVLRQQQLQRQKQLEDEREDQDDHQDGEITGDMEMDDDDATPPPNHSAPLTPQGHHSQLHMPHAAMPSTMNLSYNTAPQTQHSQVPGLAYQSHFSPESSVPGTPLATDFDYGFPSALPAQQGHVYNAGVQYGNVDALGGDLSLDLCIDEPAKRLYSPGGQGVQSQLHMMAYREDGTGQAMAMHNMAMLPEADKPFKCPVIGCEKAYKNQNGLKYHKTHGHINQKLHDNRDGTFSIVNPETSTPYPGTLGMEKEKPYRCDFCGKRYKNLNGLKYHRNHSTHGDMQLPHQAATGGVVAVAGGIAGENGLL